MSSAPVLRSFPRVFVHQLGKTIRPCLFGESLVPDAVDARLCLQRLSDGVVLSNAGGVPYSITADSGIELPISFKEASPALLATGSALEDVPVRLSVVVLGECKLAGQQGLIITRRLLQVKQNQAAWNSLWVFPGGGVDVGETLEEAAVREFREETGLAVAPSSLVPIGLWQAAVAPQHKQYLVVLFKGQVVDDSSTQVDLAAREPQLQLDEVSAMAFLPRDVLHMFVDNWTHGAQDQMEAAKADVPCIRTDCFESAAPCTGWEVVQPQTDDVGATNQHRTAFSLKELEGDGGLRAGIGGAHRFGILRYLKLLDPSLSKPYQHSSL